MAGEKVLVTGASGFIAKHVIAELIRQGYAAQGTVRNLDHAEEVASRMDRRAPTWGPVVRPGPT